MSVDKKKVSFSDLQKKFLSLSRRPAEEQQAENSLTPKFKDLDSSHFVFSVGVPESTLIAGSLCDSGCKSCSGGGGCDGLGDGGASAGGCASAGSDGACE